MYRHAIAIKMNKLWSIGALNVWVQGLTKKNQQLFQNYQVLILLLLFNSTVGSVLCESTLCYLKKPGVADILNMKILMYLH